MGNLVGDQSAYGCSRLRSGQLSAGRHGLLVLVEPDQPFPVPMISGWRTLEALTAHNLTQPSSGSIRQPNPQSALAVVC
jgi:hypothetical protein